MGWRTHNKLVHNTFKPPRSVSLPVVSTPVASRPASPYDGVSALSSHAASASLAHAESAIISRPDSISGSHWVGTPTKAKASSAAVTRDIERILLTPQSSSQLPQIQQRASRSAKIFNSSKMDSTVSLHRCQAFKKSFAGDSCSICGLSREAHFTVETWAAGK